MSPRVKSWLDRCASRAFVLKAELTLMAVAAAVVLIFVRLL